MKSYVCHVRELSCWFVERKIRLEQIFKINQNGKKSKTKINKIQLIFEELI